MMQGWPTLEEMKAFIALTGMATFLGALVSAVATLVSTYVKWRLDSHIGRKQSLRDHHLKQLEKLFSSVDDVILWHEDLLVALRVHGGNNTLIQVVEKLLKKEPVWSHPSSVTTTLVSSEGHSQVFSDAYTDLTNTYKRCAAARVTALRDNRPVDLSNAVSDLRLAAAALYLNTLRAIYDD
jgi:hypothetical protein